MDTALGSEIGIGSEIGMGSDAVDRLEQRERYGECKNQIERGPVGNELRCRLGSGLKRRLRIKIKVDG